MTSSPSGPETSVPRSRRGVLLAAVAVGAAAAGAGLAFWRTRLSNPEETAVAQLWSHSFATPQGGTLAMAALRGRPLVVNFWATWCPPCVEELPMLDAFFRKNSSKQWQVVGLAIDQPNSVRTFLQRNAITFPVGLAGLEGSQLAKNLGNIGGGLPFTVVLGEDGAIRQRRLGKLRQEDLDAWTAERKG